MAILTIDSTAIDNDTTVFAHGQHQDSFDASGGRLVKVDLFIEDASAFATTYANLIAACRTRNKRVQVQFHGGSDVIDINPSANTGVVGVVTTPVDDPTHRKTDVSACISVIIAAQYTNPLTTFATGMEAFSLETSTDAAGRGQKTLTMLFGPAGGDTGATNYTNARSSLLTTYMLTDSDGTWNSSNKYALIVENTDTVEGESNLYRVVLVSQFFATGFTTSDVRDYAMTISSSIPEEWPSNIPRPTYITAAGHAIAPLSGDVWALRDSVRTDVLAALASAGISNPKKLREQWAADITTGLIRFTLDYQIGQLTYLAVSRSGRVEIRYEAVKVSDSDGFTHIQESNASPIVVHDVTVSHRALVGTRITINPPSAVVRGRKLWKESETVTVAQPVTTEFGRVQTKQITAQYSEVKMKRPPPAQQGPAIDPVGVLPR